MEAIRSFGFQPQLQKALALFCSFVVQIWLLNFSSFILFIFIVFNHFNLFSWICY